ncbi:hypothetical protein ACFS5N_16350 [Mucilaginibacter ximonensis]|uniref:Uncharacterized protein n=1 Tax=Mucilaginibacter ximonensis TaxID=538021 RepID=A0ABW5YGN9_9SPHI
MSKTTKYYWMCVECTVVHSGSAYKFTRVLNYHPFEYIDSVNDRPDAAPQPGAKRQYVLLNWQEITREDYELGERLDPEL